MSIDNFTLSITATDLTIIRGGLSVVLGVNFTLSPGQALILRGNNGAGKTSLLRGIAGLSQVSANSLLFSDKDGPVDADEAAHTSIHYLSHNNGLYHEMTVAEHARTWDKLIPASVNDVPDLLQNLEYWGIASLNTLFVSKLSAGQKRRVALSRLTLKPRALWLLDEPGTALDADGIKRLSAAIAAHREVGGIVIQTAHDGFVPPNAQEILLKMPPPEVL